MADAVIGGDVGDRRAGRGGGDQLLGFVAVRVRKQDRAGLGVERLDLANAVVFLVHAGEFVLADAIGIVVGDRRGGDQTGLRVGAHDQPVSVVTGLGVANEDVGGDQFLQVLGRLGINLGCVMIHFRRQIDLGLGNVQEGVGFAGGADARFIAGKHVIRRRGDGSGVFGTRPQAGKRTDQGAGGGQSNFLS